MPRGLRSIIRGDEKLHGKLTKVDFHWFDREFVRVEIRVVNDAPHEGAAVRKAECIADDFPYELLELLVACEPLEQKWCRRQDDPFSAASVYAKNFLLI